MLTALFAARSRINRQAASGNQWSVVFSNDFETDATGFSTWLQTTAWSDGAGLGSLQSSNTADSTSATTNFSQSLTDTAQLVFDYATSTEASFDKLSITINGVIVVNGISGDNIRQMRIGLPAGTATFAATYSKDGSAAAGRNACNIDNFLIRRPSGVLSPLYKGDNIAYGTLVTTSVPRYTPTGYEYVVTNNALGSTGTDTYLTIASSGLQYVTVDLGGLFNISKIIVWHYWQDGRTYHGTKTEVSSDGVAWTPVFDSAVSGEYAETSYGHVMYFDQRPVRYIRDYASGSTTNGDVHWQEIQAFLDEGGKDAYIASLLNLNGLNNSLLVPDEKGSPWACRGTAKIDTSVSKYGSGSLLLDGASGYLEAPAGIPELMPMKNEDFTWRGYVYPTVSQSSSFFWCYSYPGAGYSIPFYIGFCAPSLNAYADGTTFGAGFFDAGANQHHGISSGVAPTLNAWQHVELCVKGSMWYLFVEGVLSASGALPNNRPDPFNSTIGRPLIGRRWDTTGPHPYFAGRLQGVEFIKGVALHTANFTPPPAPEAADPTVSNLWYDAFSTDDLANYTSTGGSTNSITGGQLVMQAGNQSILYPTGVSFQDGYVEAMMTQSDDGGLIARLTAGGDYYLMLVNDNSSLVTANQNTVTLYRSAGGAFNIIGAKTSMGTKWLRGTRKKFRLEVLGSQILAYVDDKLIVSASDTSYPAAGGFGLRSNTAGAVEKFDWLRVVGS